MQLYSTNDRSNVVDLREAVLNAFPKDRGLYMPTHIPTLPSDFVAHLDQYSLPEIGFMVTQAMVGDYMSESDLYGIISRAIDFPAPLVSLSEQLHSLELWHGPTMAFKDFGARFMAELMSHFLRGEDRPTTILVATSGDTGGAVAAGFHKVPGIEVIILYPSGKVSALQEQQLTTWGDNISAIEIDGVFDDCQALVKQAFLDEDLKEKYQFSSANSINIARLLPQSFYYWEGYRQLKDKSAPLVTVVPSGNFGNLTAGLIAKRMGLPIHRFIAATNANKTVPDYLASGEYTARPSVATLSNAMDVGDPSNFPRMQALYGGAAAGSSTWNKLKIDLTGQSLTDADTSQAMVDIHEKFSYVADPHGAVGFLAAEEHLKHNPNHQCMVLETAHPGKFSNVMPKEIKWKMPNKLKNFMSGAKTAARCGKTYDEFKKLLSS